MAAKLLARYCCHSVKALHFAWRASAVRHSKGEDMRGRKLMSVFRAIGFGGADLGWV